MVGPPISTFLGLLSVLRCKMYKFFCRGRVFRNYLFNNIFVFSETDFGCCPDNVTAARGQDNLGCGCTHSPYGCCADQVTVADPEGVQNCPCDTTEYGCCSDGETVAQGPNLEGRVRFSLLDGSTIASAYSQMVKTTVY